jgi:alpha-1,3-fucosyltransferase
VTYRLDSDLKMIYGGIVDIETGKLVAPARNIKWKNHSSDFFDDRLLEIAKNKTKDVVWMSSNCFTPSQREKFSDELSNYGVGVDNLGLCSALKRNDTLNSINIYNSNRRSDHHEEIKNYLFYGAFENSLCKDYVTEKVFSNFKRDIVLVVYGGANYSDFLPPNSYIDANEFKTVKDLAVTA